MLNWPSKTPDNNPTEPIFKKIPDSVPILPAADNIVRHEGAWRGVYNLIIGYNKDTYQDNYVNEDEKDILTPDDESEIRSVVNNFFKSQPGEDDYSPFIGEDPRSYTILGVSFKSKTGSWVKDYTIGATECLERGINFYTDPNHYPEAHIIINSNAGDYFDYNVWLDNPRTLYYLSELTDHERNKSRDLVLKNIARFKIKIARYPQLSINDFEIIVIGWRNSKKYYVCLKTELPHLREGENVIEHLDIEEFCSPEQPEPTFTRIPDSVPILDPSVRLERHAISVGVYRRSYHEEQPIHYVSEGEKDLLTSEDESDITRAVTNYFSEMQSNEAPLFGEDPRSYSIIGVSDKDEEKYFKEYKIVITAQIDGHIDHQTRYHPDSNIFIVLDAVNYFDYNICLDNPRYQWWLPEIQGCYTTSIVIDNDDYARLENYKIEVERAFIKSQRYHLNTQISDYVAVVAQCKPDLHRKQYIFCKKGYEIQSDQYYQVIGSIEASDIIN